MPKKQTTAARKAREAARDGAKYTTALKAGPTMALLIATADDVLCERCGWTNAMVCPECPGCGCYNGRCSGWRHHEYAEDDHEPRRCEECGAADDSPYGCACYDGPPELSSDTDTDTDTETLKAVRAYYASNEPGNGSHVHP